MIKPILLVVLTSLLLAFQNCAPLSSNENCEGGDCFDSDSITTMSCSFDGEDVRHGNAVNAFLSSSGSTCTQETRTCDNGNLSGSYQFSSCSTAATHKSCLFNGRTIAHNSRVDAFLSSTVDSGSSCVSESRVCNDGVLSGTYQYAACSVSAAKKSCLFNGSTIAHGSSIRAFLHSSSLSTENLCNSSQLRTCNDGQLSGSYTYASCNINAPRVCSFNGRTVAHNQSVTAYRNSTLPFSSGSAACEQTSNKETRTCNNGTLSGSYTHESCALASASTCSFNGQTIPHNGTVIAYLNSTTPFSGPSQCTTETRRCNNGALSGSYRFASCTQNAARSCVFDDKTIPHNGTVNGYRDSSGFNGGVLQCNPVVKRCTDGTLSMPEAQFSSCTMKDPKSCLFNGKTILHNSSVLAYFENEVTTECRSENRRCVDGVLSGTATHERCAFRCQYGPQVLKDNQVMFVGYHGVQKLLGKDVHHFWSLKCVGPNTVLRQSLGLEDFVRNQCQNYRIKPGVPIPSNQLGTTYLIPNEAPPTQLPSNGSLYPTGKNTFCDFF